MTTLANTERSKFLSLLESHDIFLFHSEIQWETTHRETVCNRSSSTNRDVWEDVTAGQVITAIVSMVDLYVFCLTTISTAAKMSFSRTEQCQHYNNIYHKFTIHNTVSSTTDSSAFYPSHVPLIRGLLDIMQFWIYHYCLFLHSKACYHEELLHYYYLY